MASSPTGAKGKARREARWKAALETEEPLARRDTGTVVRTNRTPRQVGRSGRIVTGVARQQPGYFPPLLAINEVI